MKDKIVADGRLSVLAGREKGGDRDMEA